MPTANCCSITLRGAEYDRRIGQSHAAAGAEKQRLFQKSLEAADLLADCRLGIKSFGGLMKTAQTRRLLQTAQCA